MGLRLILVGMVASLGLDLPKGDEVRSWTRTGQTWLCTALDEWNAWMTPDVADQAEDRVEPARVAAKLVEGASELTTRLTAEATADAEFAAVVEEMVAGLSTETEREGDGGEVMGTLVRGEAAGRVGSSGTMTAIEVSEDEYVEENVVAFEPLEVGDDLYPGLAYALNRDSEVVADAGATPAPIVAEEATSVEARAVAMPVGAGQRLSTAVRLTGEAIHAWANLLRGPAVVSIHP
jgi:hypothetical protein